MLLSLDLSVLFLALPHLSAGLGASNTEQLWITDIYGFMTAGFLITMGSLGDRIGRRKLLLIGAAGFGIASALAAYSTSPGMLIATRALLGIAGATILPSTLALIRNMFHDPKQMGVAFAGWTTTYMAGIALGPVVGGALLDNFWWGSVFLLGVPVMLVLLVAGPLLLPEHRDPGAAGRLDLTSVALSLAAILPVIYGLKELAGVGVTVVPILAIIVGVGFGVLFVVRQRKLADPLLDLRLFGIRTLRATVIMAVLIAAIQNGNTLIAALYLQLVRGLTPLQAGLWLVLPALGLIVTINATPHLARRFRPGYVYATGLVVSAAGYLLLTQVDATQGIALLVIGLIIVSAGIGPAGALTNQLVMGAAPPERAGSAASLTSTGGEFGIALGIATLGSIGTTVFRSQLTLPAGVPSDLAGTARHSIVGAVDTARQLPGAVGDELLAAARDAFTTTLNTVAAISAVLLLAVGVLAAFLLRHEGRTGEGQSDGSADNTAADAPASGAEVSP
jgi:DHA2 family multidrug resistance protein-like MFS transporter